LRASTCRNPLFLSAGMLRRRRRWTWCGSVAFPQAVAAQSHDLSSALSCGFRGECPSLRRAASRCPCRHASVEWARRPGRPRSSFNSHAPESSAPRELLPVGRRGEGAVGTGCRVVLCPRKARPLVCNEGKCDASRQETNEVGPGVFAQKTSLQSQLKTQHVQTQHVLARPPAVTDRTGERRCHDERTRRKADCLGKSCVCCLWVARQHLTGTQPGSGRVAALLETTTFAATTLEPGTTIDSPSRID
jgi:hypothetical protein